MSYTFHNEINPIQTITPQGLPVSLTHGTQPKTGTVVEKPREKEQQFKLGKIIDTHSRRMTLLEFMKDNVKKQNPTWVCIQDLGRFYKVDLGYSSTPLIKVREDLRYLQANQYIEILDQQGSTRKRDMLVRFTSKFIPENKTQTYMPKYWRTLQKTHSLKDMEMYALIEINYRPNSFSYSAFKKKIGCVDQEFTRVIRKLEALNLLKRSHSEDEILDATQFKMNLPKA